jgi:hypothetical protein
VRRVAAVFGWGLNPARELKTSVPESTKLAGTRGRADFTTDPIGVYALRGLTLQGAGWRDRKSLGVTLTNGGTLTVTMDLGPRARLLLHLDHQALENHVAGSAPIRVVFDGREAVRAWQPPLAYYRKEVFDLGVHEPGGKTLVLTVSPRARTLYSLRGLEIEAVPPK